MRHDGQHGRSGGGPRGLHHGAVDAGRYELVIFDNDGVLVDSEPLSNRALAAYLTELGHPTTYEDSLRDYMGSALHRVHDLVWERTGRRLPADFDETFHRRVFAEFRRELRPVHGVAEVLAQLTSEGVPYCVASSGHHERIRVTHRTTGLDAYIEEGRVFSAQDVGQGKPAPDLFLHAAATMGVAPERCAVVEDSPLGVRAAVAAGMDVYGFTAMTPAAQLTGATALFSAMAELPRHLGRPGS
ncbi:HAD family hydrolase [Streptomyces sp. PLAI1-29]|uniref:HAD family hydrolase n=2 Tax=Streptomyces zingiberis TaxID=2053010 RepID=A0ABX1CA52_9ACTN|nr:HAD family hydrolase [Streptomyces zingiberis]